MEVENFITALSKSSIIENYVFKNPKLICKSIAGKTFKSCVFNQGFFLCNDIAHCKFDNCKFVDCEFNQIYGPWIKWQNCHFINTQISFSCLYQNTFNNSQYDKGLLEATNLSNSVMQNTKFLGTLIKQCVLEPIFKDEKTCFEKCSTIISSIINKTIDEYQMLIEEGEKEDANV